MQFSDLRVDGSGTVSQDSSHIEAEISFVNMDLRQDWRKSEGWCSAIVDSMIDSQGVLCYRTGTKTQQRFVHGEVVLSCQVSP